MNHFNNTSPEDQVRYNPSEVFQAWMFNHHIANTAYPIKHGETMWFYRPRNSGWSLSKEIKETMTRETRHSYDDIGLYIHVPFCEHRCGFCDYAVMDPKQFHNALSHDNYFKTLTKEIELFHTIYGRKKISWFDIGWWTPSAVDSRHIAEILNTVHKHFSVPENLNISIETTPKIASLEPEKIQSYHDMWIDRISMGIQTINPKILKQVGRENTSIDWNHKATDHIRKAWFDSYNVDIMYGLPNMTSDQIISTMTHILSLSPDHVTQYRTRYKWTWLQERGYQIELDWILQQWTIIKNMLHENGYLALVGKNTFSRIPNDSGASAYLTNRVVYGTPYVGFGLWSQSLSPTMLSYNHGVATKDRTQYQKSVEQGKLPIQDIYHLSPEMSAGKFISVSFYFWGIHLPSFNKNYNRSLESMFPEEIAYVLEHNLMHYEDDRLQLTEHGTKYYNGVIALFYAGSIKKYLLERKATQESMSTI